MKKIIFSLICFLVVGAIALQSNVPNNNLVKENARVIILAPNCSDVKWQDHCVAVLEDVNCRVSVTGGICSFKFMRSRSAALEPPGLATN